MHNVVIKLCVVLAELIWLPVLELRGRRFIEALTVVLNPSRRLLMRWPRVLWRRRQLQRLPPVWVGGFAQQRHTASREPVRGALELVVATEAAR